MLTTYRALLRGNHLEWLDEVPVQIADADEIPVQITILEEVDLSLPSKTQGQQMSEALEQLAIANKDSKIGDPLLWEREVRKDRELPGRVG